MRRGTLPKKDAPLRNYFLRLLKLLALSLRSTERWLRYQLGDHEAQVAAHAPQCLLCPCLIAEAHLDFGRLPFALVHG